MGNPHVAWAFLVAVSHGLAVGAPDGRPGLNQAASLYHQARYDSSLARLEALKSGGPWKRRDSLSLFQYLGMASAKLRRDSSAVAYFSELLLIDSLFQFARNEDSVILRDFRSARDFRASKGTSPVTVAPVPAIDPDEDSSPDSTQTLRIGPVPSSSAPSQEVGSAKGAAVSPEATRAYRKVSLAYGALPLGSGWMARGHVKSGLALGLLQAGGILLSVYASEAQSRQQNDAYRVRDRDELASVKQWQWIQRISLSTALGAYLFSLIASGGD